MQCVSRVVIFLVETIFNQISQKENSKNWIKFVNSDPKNADELEEKVDISSKLESILQKCLEVACDTILQNITEPYPKNSMKFEQYGSVNFFGLHYQFFHL